MKFFKYNNNWNKIISNKLTAIYGYNNKSAYGQYVHFFLNGVFHNIKNASFIRSDGYKIFSLNGKTYGYKNDFTKQSWRKFVKLQIFL